MGDIITIDGAGRVVIPKRVRDHLALKDGSRLRVVEDGARVVLEPVEEVHTPVEVDGLLVVQARLTGTVPDHRDVRDERAKRASRD
jgi:AbrB family looped-hinge helix DNA binding protein